MWLFWVALSISILETVREIVLTFYLKEWTANVKGLFWILRREKTLS
jgi:hypothetical protein